MNSIDQFNGNTGRIKELDSAKIITRSALLNVHVAPIEEVFDHVEVAVATGHQQRRGSVDSSRHQHGHFIFGPVIQENLQRRSNKHRCNYFSIQIIGEERDENRQQPQVLTERGIVR